MLYCTCNGLSVVYTKYFLRGRVKITEWSMKNNVNHKVNPQLLKAQLIFMPQFPNVQLQQLDTKIYQFHQ